MTIEVKTRPDAAVPAPWPRLPRTWRYVQRTAEREPICWLSKEDGLYLHRSGYVQAETRLFNLNENIDFETPTGTRICRSGRSVLFVLSPLGDEACYYHDGVEWQELVPMDWDNLGWLSRLELYLRRLVDWI